MSRLIRCMMACGLLLSAPLFGQEQAAQQQFSPQERIEMLKLWLMESKELLRDYQWIETASIAIDGEVKAQKRSQVYYAIDGSLQKIPINDEEEESGGPPGVLPPGRLAQRRIAKKKEQLEEYMQEAKAVLETYVPPEPGLLQQAYGTGNFGLNMLQPGQLARLEFRNYRKSGDLLSFDIEVPTNRLAGIQIQSYLDSPSDPVSANVSMGVLPDGTIHISKTVLNAPSEDAVVTVENSGYRKGGG